MCATWRVCWTFSFHSILSSFLLSSSSSSRNRAIPARSSSLAIQCGSSYSFPSSRGPIFMPASSISGQLRLTTILTCEFSKMKSTSRMGVSDFAVVNLMGSLLSLLRRVLEEKVVLRFKRSRGNKGWWFRFVLTWLLCWGRVV